MNSLTIDRCIKNFQGGGGGGVLGSVSDRDAQQLPSTRNATRAKKKGGGGSKLYILPNIEEKYGSKYDIFLIFC